MTFDSELECPLLIDIPKKKGTLERESISEYIETEKPELWVFCLRSTLNARLVQMFRSCSKHEG